MPTLPSSSVPRAATAAAHTISIVLADDHRLFRAGLRRLLESEADLQVIGEAADGDEALDLVREMRPDVLLLDLCMRRRTGLDVLRTLASSPVHRQMPSGSPMHAIVLTGAIDDGQMIETLQLGARGIVMKDCAAPLLFKSIRAVMQGECWIGRERVDNLVRYIQSARATAHEDARRPPFGLTPRERQVIGALVAGDTNRDIAQRFSLSEDTVKHHLTHIFDKCGVSNRLELAMFAVAHHVVEMV